MKALFACVLLAAAAPFARADITVGVYANVPGEAVDSVDQFYDELAPYGSWTNDPEIGTDVFIPSDPDYVPYTNGHWEYTDIGMVWVSSEPFAWATAHYGRWFYSNTYGRWAWMPDTQWGPSWVEWREAGDTFGWAPIPPTVIVDRGYREPMYAWHFAPAQRLVDPDLDRYYVPQRDLPRYQRSARPLQAYGQFQNRQVVVGPHPEVLRQHNVTVQPHRLDARAMGRVNPGELRQRAPSQPQRRSQPAPQPRAIEPHAQQSAPQPAPQPRPESRPMQVTPRPMPQPMQRTQPAPQPRPAPQPMHRAPEPQPAPQPRAMQSAPQPRPEARPMQVAPRPEPRPMQVAPQPRPQPQPQARPQPQPQARPQPQPQPQAREQHPSPPPQAAHPQPRRDDKRNPHDR